MGNKKSKSETQSDIFFIEKVVESSEAKASWIHEWYSAGGVSAIKLFRLNAIKEPFHARIPSIIDILICKKSVDKLV